MTKLQATATTLRGGKAILVAFSALSVIVRNSASLLSIAFCLLSTVAVAAQEPIRTPTQQVEQNLPVPAIAPDFRSEQKPLPELGRVGVDMERQQPLAAHDR